MRSLLDPGSGRFESWRSQQRSRVGHHAPAGIFSFVRDSARFKTTYSRLSRWTALSPGIKSSGVRTHAEHPSAPSARDAHDRPRRRSYGASRSLDGRSLRGFGVPLGRPRQPLCRPTTFRNRTARHTKALLRHRRLRVAWTAANYATTSDCSDRYWESLGNENRCLQGAYLSSAPVFAFRRKCS